MSDKNSEREVYRESTGTAWFAGIIVALALLSIGYLVFSAGDCRSDVCGTTVEVSK